MPAQAGLSRGIADIQWCPVEPRRPCHLHESISKYLGILQETTPEILVTKVEAAGSTRTRRWGQHFQIEIETKATRCPMCGLGIWKRSSRRRMEPPKVQNPRRREIDLTRSSPLDAGQLSVEGTLNLLRTALSPRYPTDIRSAGLSTSKWWCSICARIFLLARRAGYAKSGLDQHLTSEPQ